MKRKSTGPTTRDMGFNHGQAGKGSAARSCFSQAFQDNMDAIQRNPDAVIGLLRVGPSKLRKVYTR